MDSKFFTRAGEPENKVAMRIISIISCKIFEAEIVHLVDQDEEVDKVLILKNEISEDIIRKFGKIGHPCRELTLKNVEAHRSFRDVQHERDEELMRVLNVLEVIGTGKQRTRLKMNTYDAVMRMSLFSDGLLLLYGFCGGVLKNIEKDFTHLEHPLVLLGMPKETSLMTASVRHSEANKLSWKQ